MPRYLVSIPYTDRIVEADDEDEACDRFIDDETVYYEIEVERLPDSPEARPEASRCTQTLKSSQKRQDGA